MYSDKYYVLVCVTMGEVMNITHEPTHLEAVVVFLAGEVAHALGSYTPNSEAAGNFWIVACIKLTTVGM